MKKLIALITLCALTANATQTITNVFLGFNPPDDGTGDPAYTAFTKINSNFLLCTNLIDVQSNYFQGLFDGLSACTAVAVSGPNLSASTNSSVVTLSTDAGTLATNHVTATSNALYQAKVDATNTLAGALTGNLNTASNTLRQATIDSTNGLPRGVTASGSATATTNANGVVDISVTGTGGDVTLDQLVAATNHALLLTTNHVEGVSNVLRTAINGKMYSPGTQPPHYFWMSPANGYGTLVPRLPEPSDYTDYLTNWVSQAPGYLPSYATKPLTDFQPVLATGTSEHQALLWHSGSPGAYYPHAIPLSIDGLTGAVTLNGHVATNLQSANWLSGSHDAFTVWDYAAAGGSRAFVVYSGADPGEILIANYQGIKMPEVTASRALTTDANNYVVGSSTTSDELSYVHGVTSAIQTQLDNRIKGIIASTGFNGSTNNGVVTLSATSSSGALLSGSITYIADGDAEDILTASVPDNSTTVVNGLFSVHGAGGTVAGARYEGVLERSGSTYTWRDGPTIEYQNYNPNAVTLMYSAAAGTLHIYVEYDNTNETCKVKWEGQILTTN